MCLHLNVMNNNNIHLNIYLINTLFNQTGDHWSSSPSSLPQHTRLYQPRTKGLGVHQSNRKNITQRVGESAVPWLSTTGDVLLRSVTNQPGWDAQPAAACPNATLQTRLFKKSRFISELDRARFVPQGSWSPAGGAAGGTVQTSGMEASDLLCFIGCRFSPALSFILSTPWFSPVCHERASAVSCEISHYTLF